MTFETVIDKFVVDTEDKMLMVVKDSVSAVIKDAQSKVRVDTGFLRASGVSSLNTLPMGPSVGRERNPGEIGVLPEYKTFGTTIEDSLIRMKIGDVFYFGWTANYAKYREAYDGFLESAVQKWKEHVKTAVRKLKSN